ncbi:MAG: hypothetical protein IJ326_12640 [Lachnospiraceae bacterium]|nr:hypothetical protein [Lachnospiraceae bacterium]
MIKKARALLERYAVEIATAVYLIYMLYINVADRIYSYVNVWYVLDYSYGFGSRLMLGSLLHMLTGDFIDEKFVYHFIIMMLAVLCILLAILVGMVYRKIEHTDKKAGVLFLIVFYLASPAAPGYLWTDENMGRLDTYLFICALALALIFCKVKRAWLRYVLFVLIGVFAISVHQVYFFLFFPSLLVMMIQDMWKAKFAKKQIILSVGSVVIIGIVFLFMQFGSGIYYDDLAVLISDMSKTTNIAVSEAPLEAEYWWTIKDHIVKNQLPELPERIRFGVLTVAMLVPVWGISLYIWIQAIKSKQEKLQKCKYWLMLLSNIAYVPVFALMTDWGRWFAAFFVVTFLNLMVLIYDGDEGIGCGVEKLSTAVRRYPIVFIVLVLYVASFEKFEGINYLNQVQDFFYQTYDLKELLLG